MPKTESFRERVFVTASKAFSRVHEFYVAALNPHPDKPNYNLICIRVSRTDPLVIWLPLNWFLRCLRQSRLHPCFRGQAVQWCCRRCHRKSRYTVNRYGGQPNLYAEIVLLPVWAAAICTLFVIINFWGDIEKNGEGSGITWHLDVIQSICKL